MKNAGKNMFFASAKCDHCGRTKKLAIEPRFVLLFWKRLAAAYKDQARSAQAILELAQKDIEEARSKRQ